MATSVASATATTTAAATAMAPPVTHAAIIRAEDVEHARTHNRPETIPWSNGKDSLLLALKRKRSVQKTDDWHKRAYDYMRRAHVCLNDRRSRVTWGLTMKITQMLLPPEHVALMGLTYDAARHFAEVPDWRERALHLAFAIASYPVRPELERALCKQFDHLAVRDLSAAATETPVLTPLHAKPARSAAAAAVVSKGNPTKRATRKRKLDEMSTAEHDVAANDRDDDNNEEEDDDDNVDRDGIKTPTIRERLAEYWRLTDNIRKMVVLGRPLEYTITQMQPVLELAARLANSDADDTLRCHHTLTPVAMAGVIVNLPTQYPCEFDNYVLCAECGVLMHAREWRYVTGVGYVCAAHRDVTDRAIPVDAMNESFLPRPITSTNARTRLRVVAPMAQLQVQPRYYITHASQINGLPDTWINLYGFDTVYEALLNTRVDRQSRQRGSATSVVRQHYCAAPECRSIYMDTVPVLRADLKQRVAVRPLDAPMPMPRVQIYNYCQTHLHV
jgi:hypothetical protein